MDIPFKDHFTIQELSIVIVAKNHNPTILNPDFLKYNKIVPLDWELSSNPICIEPIAQVSFKNGITIRAEFEKLIFSEDLKDKTKNEIKIPKIAHQYVETLPHVYYKAVGINPLGYIPISNEYDTTDFIIKNLITSGPWQRFENTAAKVSVKFIYTLEGLKCYLDIEEGLVEEKIPVILFRANFHHDIDGSTKEDKPQHLYLTIDNWEKDLEIFRKIVIENFLIKGKS